MLVEYDPEDTPELKPGRVVRGATQILVRLIRDKVWSILVQAVSLTNVLFDHFIFVNSVAKKEIRESGSSPSFFVALLMVLV